jgi:hypothetical protein
MYKFEVLALKRSGPWKEERRTPSSKMRIRIEHILYIYKFETTGVGVEALKIGTGDLWVCRSPTTV